MKLLISPAKKMREDVDFFASRQAPALLERAAVGDLEPCRPAGPPMWGVVRTYGGGTGVPFVLAP